MTTTAEMLRQRIGEELGIVPVGQILESQDQVRIDAAYNEIYEILKERGLAGWAYTGDIPDKVVPYLATLIEQKLLVGYSVPDTRYVRITNDAGANGEVAIAKISAMVTQEYESTDDNADY